MLHIKQLSKLLVVIIGIYLPVYATKAFAWGAVAAWDGRVTFVSYNKATPQLAKESALKGCEDAAMRRCEILGDAGFGTALITAQSVNRGGVVVIGDRNPLEAAKKAMTSCKIQYGDCVIVSAVWDGGPAWQGLRT